MVGCLALAWRCDQRASFGTQKTFSARYSSGSSAIGEVLGQQRRALGLEGVGDVFEEDQAERDVLVVRGLHVAAQLVGRGPELGLEAEVSAAAVARCERLVFRLSSAGVRVTWVMFLLVSS